MTKSKKNAKDSNAGSKSKKAIITKESIKNPLLKLKDFKTIKKDYNLSDQELVPIIVLQKISEHAELYLKIIQQILQPEEFHSMYECSAFTEVEKQELLELYKKIMFLHRELLKSEIINEEENILLAIEKVYKQLVEIKPTMLKIVVKMQGSWDVSLKNLLKTKSAQYFG